LAIYFPRVLQAFCDGRSLNCQSAGALVHIESQAADTVQKKHFLHEKLTHPAQCYKKFLEKFPFFKIYC